MVALRDVAPGEEINAGAGIPALHVQQAIRQGHKLAVEQLAPGTAVRTLGQVIGVASQAIAPGEHVHTHHLLFAPGAAERAVEASRLPVPDLSHIDGQQPLARQ